jgi:hypothetical protein
MIRLFQQTALAVGEETLEALVSHSLHRQEPVAGGSEDTMGRLFREQQSTLEMMDYVICYGAAREVWPNENEQRAAANLIKSTEHITHRGPCGSAVADAMCAISVRCPTVSARRQTRVGAKLHTAHSTQPLPLFCFR